MSNVAPAIQDALENQQALWFQGKKRRGPRT